MLFLFLIDKLHIESELKPITYEKIVLIFN